MSTFPVEFVEKFKESGSVAGYKGPCWIPYITWDLDREKLADAIADTVKLVETLVTLSAGGLTPLNVIVAFSGNRGFHVQIDTCVLGDAAVPSEYFAVQCKAFAVHVAREAGIVIDDGIYQTVHLLRCLNSWHSGGGYKIPFGWEEMLAESALPWVLQRAAEPRRLVDVTADGIAIDKDDVPYHPPAGVVPALSELWQKLAEKTEERKPLPMRAISGTGQPGVWPAQTQQLPISKKIVPRLRRDSIDFITRGVPEGRRAKDLFPVAADCIRCGWSEDAIYSLLMDVGSLLGLGPVETERQINCGIQSETDAQQSS